MSKEDLRAGEDRKLIPEGKYTAQCFEAKKGMVGVETTKGTFARTPKIVLRFKIIDGQYRDKRSPCFSMLITNVFLLAPSFINVG